MMNEEIPKMAGREEVIAAIQKAVEKANGERVSLDQFLKESGLRYNEVFNHFARWDDALEAAGYRFRRHNAMIETAALLEDWGRVARQLQRPPTRADYRVMGNYATRTLTVRFKKWGCIARAFMEFAGDGPKWADVRKLIAAAPDDAGVKPAKKPNGNSPVSSQGLRQTQLKYQRRARASRRERGRKEAETPVFGQRLGMAALEHAPTNEAGVVYLFGVLAERMGFCVERMGQSFPDCEVKRLVGPDVWERLRVEIEYESRNFKLHKHPADGCDLIVCWVHNWPECPVEVIALKDEAMK